MTSWRSLQVREYSSESIYHTWSRRILLDTQHPSTKLRWRLALTDLGFKICVAAANHCRAAVETAGAASGATFDGLLNTMLPALNEAVPLP